MATDPNEVACDTRRKTETIIRSIVQADPGIIFAVLALRTVFVLFGGTGMLAAFQDQIEQALRRLVAEGDLFYRREQGLRRYYTAPQIPYAQGIAPAKKDTP